jgi:hypothetical protein
MLYMDLLGLIKPVLSHHAVVSGLEIFEICWKFKILCVNLHNSMPAMNYFDSNRTNTVIFNHSWTVYTRHLVAVPFISLSWEIAGSLKWYLRVLVLNATFNNISIILWLSVLLMDLTEVSGENYWSLISHWQTLSHNVVSSAPRHEALIWLTRYSNSVLK